MNVEFAGGTTLGNVTREAVIARAPLWWRNLANKGFRSAAAAKASPKRVAAPNERDAGWLVGVVAPGESSPAYCPQDQRTLPERFDPSAWDAVMKQVRDGRKPIGLWTEHHGRMLACTSAGTLRFDVHPLIGAMFEAKIPGGPLERALLRDIGVMGLGVSVCFQAPAFRHEQRDGRTVRVITSAVVEHVALVMKTSGMRALYPAARCFGVPADKPEQLERARLEARTTAWRIMRGSAR
jgi:hypothetical protein